MGYGGNGHAAEEAAVLSGALAGTGTLRPRSAGTSSTTRLRAAAAPRQLYGVSPAASFSPGSISQATLGRRSGTGALWRSYGSSGSAGDITAWPCHVTCGSGGGATPSESPTLRRPRSATTLLRRSAFPASSGSGSTAGSVSRGAPAASAGKAAADVSQRRPGTANTPARRPLSATTASKKFGTAVTYPAIRTPYDLQEQFQVLVTVVSQLWALENNHGARQYRPMARKAKVRVGTNVYTIPEYIFPDVMNMHAIKSSPCQRAKVMEEAFLTEESFYFTDVLLLVKLRWLLRLHSACCELDFRLGSLRNILEGLQHLILQQNLDRDDIDGEGIAKEQSASEISLESVVDDLVWKLQSSMGTSWRAFANFVSTCRVDQSIHASKMHSSSRVVSNQDLLQCVDSIFVADFLRRPRESGVKFRLKEFFEELNRLGVAELRLPTLGGASHLVSWLASNRTCVGPDRSGASVRESVKLAQLDFVLLTVAFDVHDPDLSAVAEGNDTFGSASHETAFQDTTRVPVPLALHVGSGALPLVGTVDFGTSIPRVGAQLLDAVAECLEHRKVFPAGLRAYMRRLLVEDYGLEQELQKRIAVIDSWSHAGRRLPETEILGVQHSERCRLKKYSVNFRENVSHLLAPSIVPPPLRAQAAAARR